MQDPSFYSHMKPHMQQPHTQYPDEEHLKCPRCDSSNTKFCYYNNYNLSQPRHFCKSCKRYWTKGGTLRNIPLGGGCRKNTKRRSSSSATSKGLAAAASTSSASNLKKNDCQTENGEMIETLMPLTEENYGGQFGNFPEVSGSLRMLLGPREGQYSNWNGVIIGPIGSSFQKSAGFSDTGTVQNGLETGGSDNNADGFFNTKGDNGVGGGATGWNGGTNSWPDLAIYTPRSSSFPKH